MNDRKYPCVFALAGAIICPFLFFLGVDGLFLAEGGLNSTWKITGAALAPVGIFSILLFVGALALSLILWNFKPLQSTFVLSLRLVTSLMFVIGGVLAVSLAFSGAI